MIAISTFITFNSYFLLLFYTIKTLASKGINKKNKNFVEKVNVHCGIGLVLRKKAFRGGDDDQTARLENIFSR
ncbi:hypothetical protein CHH92_12590 [Bacillus sonorensis]|uniref:Uncharacterized protein n=1 Tax=Bacillus sonorensis L12 TaxID=1274524 RepID=M5PER7_9BACI|nr:hypothetical protein BSONL12_07762 [Bacillus sonorensis L12]MBG9916210.1 hypothetical protein [Bacillus sonorensis]PAD60001.1 hypothetical protein CHH92_12590 [Bacillus sonorensis]RHJ10770.1 hypothetical protein DW143_07990 [Bacillus sonorensis]TWK76135.1 hypothetical protein CHCC20335_3900 [Bacillus paralicheniformis]